MKECLYTRIPSLSSTHHVRASKLLTQRLSVLLRNCKLGSQKAEAGGSQVPVQPGLLREIVFDKGVEEESAREKVTNTQQAKVEDGNWGRRGGWASVLLNASSMFERHLSACLLSM